MNSNNLVKSEVVPDRHTLDNTIRLSAQQQQLDLAQTTAKEVWTSRLQYVVLQGDKLRFYSVEPILDPTYSREVTIHYRKNYCVYLGYTK